MHASCLEDLINKKMKKEGTKIIISRLILLTFVIFFSPFFALLLCAIACIYWCVRGVHAHYNIMKHV